MLSDSTEDLRVLSVRENLLHLGMLIEVGRLTASVQYLGVDHDLAQVVRSLPALITLSICVADQVMLTVDVCGRGALIYHHAERLALPGRVSEHIVVKSDILGVRADPHVMVEIGVEHVMCRRVGLVNAIAGSGVDPLGGVGSLRISRNRIELDPGDLVNPVCFFLLTKDRLVQPHCQVRITSVKNARWGKLCHLVVVHRSHNVLWVLIHFDKSADAKHPNIDAQNYCDTPAKECIELVMSLVSDAHGNCCGIKAANPLPTAMHP